MVFCAILLLELGLPIYLFEENKNLGKKLLATGNGCCNIHNTYTHTSCYQSSSLISKLSHIF